jgi:hypothetical protein
MGKNGRDARCTQKDDGQECPPHRPVWGNGGGGVEVHNALRQTKEQI